MFYQLMYFSIAEDNLPPEALQAIVTDAETANQRHDITGFLTFNGSEFLQFLEGPDESIRRLMNNIELDGRHHSVVTLATGRADARRFPEWSMRRLPDAPANGPEITSVQLPEAIVAAANTLDEPFRRALWNYLRG
jgi:hypothetical protein